MAKHHPDLVMCRKQPGIGFARNVTASASSAIPTCARVHLSASAMSVIMARTRGGALFAVDLASLTPTIAENVPSRKRTVTAAPRSSTWAARKRICSTSVKNMASRKDDCGWPAPQRRERWAHRSLPERRWPRWRAPK